MQVAEARLQPGSARLYTAGWKAALEANDDQVVLVRISLGKPKWVSDTLAAAIPYIPELAPQGMFHVRDRDRFRELYRERLDNFGPERVERKFRQLLEVNHGCPLVLLCFEARRVDCHRGDFAEWWEERTGEVVPEWYAPAEPPTQAPRPVPMPTQATFF